MLNKLKNTPIPTPEKWYLDNNIDSNTIEPIYHVKMKYDPRDITPISFAPTFDSILNRCMNNDDNSKVKQKDLYL